MPDPDEHYGRVAARGPEGPVDAGPRAPPANCDDRATIVAPSFLFRRYFCELCELVHTPATTPSITDNTWITLLAREGQMLHRGIAAGLAVVGLCLGPAILASTALAQEQPSAQVFQTWRTTTLGTYKSVDAYRRALDSARIRIGDAADEIVGRPVFPYTRTKTVVELAVLSAAELGVESRIVSGGCVRTRTARWS